MVLVAAMAICVILVVVVAIGFTSSVEHSVAAPPAELRGHVFFGTGPGSDACHVTGQKAVFRPGEEMYITGVMTRTVSVDSRVTIQTDVDGEAAAPIAHTEQPPYDCSAFGPVKAPSSLGTYTMRFRDASEPGSIDLASGTFMIVPSGAGDRIQTHKVT